MRNRTAPTLLTLVSIATLAAAPPEAGGGDAPKKLECATGCAAAEQKKPRLGADEIDRCLRAIAQQAPGEASLELETLLFHAPEVIPHIQDHGTGSLTPEKENFLKRELSRTHARIELRVIDSEGKLRLTFDQQVPVGVKQHLHSESAQGFTPPEVGFTVQRVGLHHLWTRL